MSSCQWANSRTSSSPTCPLAADSTTLGHPARAHLDTRSTRTWTPDPRPLGQAVGAQRRRVALLV
ncbi:hypothetical protein AO935_32710 [Pseudomonas aeruginosa]|nr:hypothetical protein AO935_32710 [Pseudomonas aeruginosa]